MSANLMKKIKTGAGLNAIEIAVRMGDLKIVQRYLPLYNKDSNKAMLQDLLFLAIHFRQPRLFEYFLDNDLCKFSVDDTTHEGLNLA